MRRRFRVYGQKKGALPLLVGATALALGAKPVKTGNRSFFMKKDQK